MLLAWLSSRAQNCDQYYFPTAHSLHTNYCEMRFIFGGFVLATDLPFYPPPLAGNSYSGCLSLAAMAVGNCGPVPHSSVWLPKQTCTYCLAVTRFCRGTADRGIIFGRYRFRVFYRTLLLVPRYHVKVNF